MRVDAAGVHGYNRANEKRGGQHRLATLHGEGFRPVTYLFMTGLLLFTLILCLCVGSVMIPLADTFDVLWSALKGNPSGLTQAHQSILLHVRMPRVLCVGLSGAALSIGGAAMQGLAAQPAGRWIDAGRQLRRVAGRSAGHCAGAVHPGHSRVGTALVAVLFAFLSLMLHPVAGVAVRQVTCPPTPSSWWAWCFPCLSAA
jgi:ABC-type Fe3+-siderophore transport system permease subunit